MAQVVLDMGSGTTCRNSIDYARRMIDAVIAIDAHKQEVIFKWQLDEKVTPPHLALDHEVFRAAYNYAAEKSYKTTSSVFDKYSLDFLLQFDVPFVKIACRPDLYWLIQEVPRKVTVYASRNGDVEWSKYDKVEWLLCVPEYPAKYWDYEILCQKYGHYLDKVSDHTTDFRIWREWRPIVWERHFVLEHDPANPDSGPFAITPDQLKEVIG